jgi:muramoyltetrapeptide carboxypeptidase LdcA involved in peptidoglycan recycling
MNMILPPRLKEGDVLATVSLSSGMAAEVHHRYAAGRRQFEEAFGVQVVEAPNSQRGSEYLYKNPGARADDLIWALTNDQVAGILTNIGGMDSVRILPHIDAGVITDNPKVFLGLSDSTIQHVAFLNAGVVSFYGPSVLTDLAENCGIHPYTLEALRNVIFSAAPPGKLRPAPEWTEHFLDWNDPGNQEVRRTFQPNPGWQWLQRGSPTEGRLVGGCIEVLEMLKGTRWWPSAETWRGGVLYFETSDAAPDLWLVEEWLRNYSSQGILQDAAGMLWGRPMRFSLEKKLNFFGVIRKVLAEVGREDMPVVADVDFGHTSPMGVIPNGCLARIDPEKQSITFPEPAVA